MEERYFDTPRGKVYYQISRAGDPEARCLVFLHGLTADHRLFTRQIDCFRQDYTLIVWDAPAHGKSRPYTDFSYANGAEDLRGILDAEGIEKAVFIGQSMGGYHAQAFLLRWPQRVEGFVGIDTCPFGEGYYSRSDCWWLRQIEWMSRCYPAGVLRHSIASGCTHTGAARDNMLEMVSQYPKRELCHLMGLGYAGFLAENRPLAITCPILLLAGEYDRTGKVLAYCHAWQKRTGFPLVIVPEAAHNSNDDNPQFVNREITAFLGTLQ